MKKFRWPLICSIFIFVCIFNIKIVHAQDKNKEILILNSYHRGLDWSDRVEEGILSKLKNNKNDNIDIKIEYMDSKENEDSTYYQKLIDLYKYKYRNEKFDLIISIDNMAFNFLLDYRDKVFPKVPLVFCGVNDFYSYKLENLNNMTGVIEEMDIQSNVDLISSLQPSTKNIAVIADNSYIGNIVCNELKKVQGKNNINITIIKEEFIKNTIDKINKLPPDSAVLFMATYLQNDNDIKIYTSKLIEYIRKNTDLPIYGIWDTAINRGVIGGKITSAFEQGKCAGELALRVLNGKSPNNIPIEKNYGMNYRFDYNQLKQFSINASKLPKGSIIINEPPSVYSVAKYKLKEAAYAVISVFMIIIAFLVMNILRRKKVEEKMNRMSKLKESLLVINQSIIGINNINELFNLILEKAIGSIKGASYGSVLLLDEDDNLRVAAYKQYDKEKIKKFSIPLKNSFIWIKTGGDIKNTVIIDDVYELDNITVVDLTSESRKWNIRSSISAPIIIDNKLYGVLNIDSNKKNSFTEDDLETLEYMRSQVEISISKHKLYEKITYLSRYDKLTNIYNRRYFEDIFCRKLKEDRNFRIVVFDLNGLKFVNDNYGHLTGDEYIKSFVNAITKIINSSDVFARYGGDEFIGIFCEELKPLNKKFEGVLSYLENNPIKFEDEFIICSFSYGIANFPEDSRCYDDLIRIADDRMYKCKQEMKLLDRKQ